MDGAPARVGIAGDWHGNAEWAVRTIGKISARLPRHRPRIILQLGDFGIWPGPDGREYLARLDAALAAASAELCFVDGNHEDFTQLAGLRPGPDGREQVTIEATGLDCDGATSGNWAILDAAGMRWRRFHGQPIRNAVRGLLAG